MDTIVTLSVENLRTISKMLLICAEEHKPVQVMIQEDGFKMRNPYDGWWTAPFGKVDE